MLILFFQTNPVDLHFHPIIQALFTREHSRVKT